MYSKDELRNLKTEFWESFSAYCEVQPYLKGRHKIWTLYNTKVKGVELKFDLSRDGVAVVLEISLHQEDQRLEMYEKLTWYKEMLEKDFPEGLIWDVCYTREKGNEVARIYCKKSGIDFHRREDWGDFFAYMARNMYLLERNFMKIAPYIRE